VFRVLNAKHVTRSLRAARFRTPRRNPHNIMRKSPALQVEEISGDQFPDLETAQNAALSLLADNLQSVIRDLLECGVLVKVEGKIVPNPELETV
jgi:hypothetical protein